MTFDRIDRQTIYPIDRRATTGDCHTNECEI